MVDNSCIYHAIGWIFDKTLNDEETALKFYELQIESYPDAVQSNTSVYNIAHIIRLKDRDRAIKLFESIADKDVDAIYMLGFLHKCVDVNKAIEWYQKGVDLNDKSCMYALGEIYYYGYRVPQDYDKAYPYYLSAANLGHYNSIYKIASYHRGGLGSIPQNDAKDAEWLEKVPYEMLDPIQKYNLGWYYIRKLQYTNKELHVKGLKMMGELVEQHNDPDAMYMIGECYKSGKCGLVRNEDIAIEWYKKAADLNDYDACVMMMNMMHTEDHYKYLCKAMQIRTNEYWVNRNRPEYNNNKKVSVEVGAIEKMYKELQDAKDRLEEYDMRPPLIGGKLFREAQERFNHVNMN